MHFADIQAAIKRAGSSQVEIARQAGASETVVYQVIRGKAKSWKVAQVVSRTTGLSVDRLWPGAYGYAKRRAA